MMRKNVFGMIAAALCAAAAHGDGPVTANWLPAAAGTVSVTVGAGAAASGEYPLLTATALDGGLDDWTKTITNESRFSAALVRRGNALYLRLLPKGTALHLR